MAENSRYGRQQLGAFSVTDVDVIFKEHSGKVSHIAHLNGLRALAFLGVAIFHFKHGCQGGFLGVDVFFVLSGYLMTRSIAAQIAASSFSYTTFLARRFWRLYPALSCTMLATLALTYGFFSSEHAIQVSRSAIASTLGLSNVLFLSEEGYFGTASVLKPLLHTWSLSVEWQFYVLWPIMMNFGSRIAPTTRPFWPITLLCLVSLMYGMTLAPIAPGEAFFLLPGRIFEFGLGALASTSSSPVTSAAMGNAMSASGTICIVLSFLYLNPSHGPPALIALPALFGALLVILSPCTVAFNRIYTSSLGEYLGRISYSAYLVHWPVYVFFHNIFEHAVAPWHVEVVVVTATMSVSILLYHHVEEQFRASRQSWHSFIGLALILSVTVFSYSGIRTNGWIGRDSPKLGASSAALSELGMRKEFDDLYAPHLEAVRMSADGDEGSTFPFGYIPKNTAKRVFRGDSFAALVVGDSFAAPLAGVFSEIAQEQKAEFVLMSRPSCTPFLDDTSLNPAVQDYDNPSNNPRVHECKGIVRHEMLELIKVTNTRTVLLIGNWANTMQMKRAMRDSVTSEGESATTGRVVSQLELTILKLLSLQKHVVILGVVPGAHYNVRACYAATGPLSFLKVCPRETSLDRLDDGNEKTRHRLRVRQTMTYLMKQSLELRKAHDTGRLVYLDPYLSLCQFTTGTCQIANRSEPYYYDDAHLALNGSMLLKHDISQALWLVNH
jgi:peptidoglycan/LPS O-acetylase OafA/YrhL